MDVAYSLNQTQVLRIKKPLPSKEYRDSIIRALKKPSISPQKHKTLKLNDTFGASAITNIILKFYNTNGRKWKITYQQDIEQEKHARISDKI